MADEHGSSRFRLPWSAPAQRVARRADASAPADWRTIGRTRLIVCAVAFAAWTAGIEARLLYLQVVQHADLVVRANRQQLTTITVSAKRGDIFDRHGRLLAYSVDADSITADPSDITDPEGVAGAVCGALDTCNSELRELMASRLRRNGQFAFLARQVSPDAARRVTALKLPGVMLVKESRRYYPKMHLASHVLGYVGVDNDGLAGLESTYDSRIRGREGKLLLQTDAREHAIFSREKRPATAGDALELTLDQTLQYITERELRAGVEANNAAGGTALVMHPQTGEILALANWPTFNPNAFGEADTDARRNRAIQDLFEPGSTFKVVTASAALEEQIIHPDDPVDCSPGYITFPGRKPIYDVHRYGVLPFSDVIVKSSNVGAIRVGARLGPERLGRYISRFGFGQPISPDFRGENPGIVWNPARLDASALASVSMGYQVAVTPIQMAAAVSSVANGGTLVEPRVVRAFIRDGRREAVAQKPLRRTISTHTAAVLTDIMEAVVERGTAKAAKIEGYTIAGKTGTAAKLVNGRYSKSEYNASFVGFAPSKEPAITVIVVIDSPHGNGFYGGTVAAPIFKRIVEASLRHLGIPADVDPLPPVVVARREAGEAAPLPVRAPAILEQTLEPAQAGLMPDLRGLSAREAIRALSRIGLAAKVKGDGFVLEQSPEPGAPLVRGDACLLTLGRRPPALQAGGPAQ